MNHRSLLLLGAVQLVAIPSTSIVLSMDTENGYLCNLCHSLQNDYPYPPPVAENRSVRLGTAEIEEFGSPFEMGTTCLNVWNNVLDFANPNIVDDDSCRRLASIYAPQCCNELPMDEASLTTLISPSLQQQDPQITLNALNNNLDATATRSPSARIGSSSIGMGRNDSSRTNATRSPSQRIGTSSIGTGRTDTNNEEDEGDGRRHKRGLRGNQ